MSSLPLVRDHMDKFVHTLRPTQDIHEAVRFLLDRRVTSAPVIVGTAELVGILSEKDCLKLVTQGHEADVAHGTVADFMTREVRSIPPKMDIYYAAGIFSANSFRRLPVVEDGLLVGGITRFDILRAIRDTRS